MIKVLKRVKETFNIHDDGRKHNPAPQSYLLASLKSVFNSSETKERIKLNEANGFYGHSIRQLTNKIDPSETEIISVDGKDVKVDVVPAVRTVSLDIDDAGNVTHEQEFLDNDMGRTALKLYEQGTGGFSWAMSGAKGMGKVKSVAKKFFGFDFVLQPNFLAKDRQQTLFASMTEDDTQALLASLESQGVSNERAQELMSLIANEDAQENDLQEIIVAHLITDNEQLTDSLQSSTEKFEKQLNDIQAEVSANDEKHQALLASKDKSLEDANAKRQQQNEMLLSALDNSPFLINDEQKQAILNIDEEGNLAIVENLFASMSQTSLDHLPHDKKTTTVEESASSGVIPEYANLDSSARQFF